jgi:NAD(P)-dependent dehydrogenase (short-subunit alcohol dehydrogenase family)
MDISGCALITGAASGIGKATAFAFARAGAPQLALLDRDELLLAQTRIEIVEELAESKGGVCEVLMVPIDVTDENAVEDACQKVAAAFGRIDYVVNSAGISFKHENGSAEVKSRDWHRVLDINLNGTFYVYRSAARIMLKQDYLKSNINGRSLQRGSIVNISSICGVVGVPLSTAYCASKHAVIGLTRTASEDYAPHGLRINAVCPGYIDTPLIQPGTITAKVAEEKSQRWTPLRRLGTADEVADAVVFLSSGRSSYITGSALMVDGGYTSH